MYGLAGAHQKLLLNPDRDRTSEPGPHWVTCCLLSPLPPLLVLELYPKFLSVHGKQLGIAEGTRAGLQSQAAPRSLQVPRCRVQIKVSWPGSAARSHLESPADPPASQPLRAPGGTHGGGVGRGVAQDDLEGLVRLQLGRQSDRE